MRFKLGERQRSALHRNACKIADAFCVTTDYLLGRSDSVAIDVSKLTEEQRGHISLLVNDLIALNSDCISSKE